MNTPEPITPNASQEKPDLYFAELIFISGEYEQHFPLFLKAFSMKQAKKMVRKHLSEYYPGASLEKEDLYFYCGGEVAIEFYKSRSCLPCLKKRCKVSWNAFLCRKEITEVLQPCL